MNAAVVEEYGTPRYRAFEEPVAGEGQLVVEVEAAGLNPVDQAKAAGRFYSGRAPLPFVAGGEGAGIVAGGRRVYFDAPVAPFGSMADRSLVNAADAIDVPDGVEPALAVAVGIAGLAAWLPLAWRAQLQPGETVLVLGATGVVGCIAVQAAKLLGAARVVAAGRNEQALARAAALGADATVRLDASEGDDLTAAFREAAGGGVDVVIDPLWGEPAVAALGALGDGGRLIQIGQSAGATATFPSAIVRGKLAEIRGHTNFLAPHDVKVAAYRTLAEHAAAGRITVEIEAAPLSEVATVWERQQAGGHGKKLVLVP
ncbi:quinone oxidoreductase family protein [Conexibacter woesei]|uniref:Alcohol dehydrogenase zinc-binding domain protein n=1 Tax=Conexibacter woesei (strain DSM 14684 / CCUG 47730 / CIP 108061 / JCM 11494 / NBRC 100937 / ID131577) TaxID=469383 RepID=D3F4K1_CONWI|nr:zinc-binding dehydrogenase [Conexibacter woesei]ADB52458.1 Alcohol dehydrogenase zinc-binding domain protein [Conexibacter woesei DSM 14684]